MGPADPDVRRAGGPLQLSRRDFERLSGFIEARFGIRMPPAKKTLLESRLARRVQELGLPGFAAYCDHVLDAADPDELVRLVDRVTTNKTDFFREPQHFDVLVNGVLPRLRGERRDGAPALRVWSAGCSTGEEPYTIAMVLAEAAEREALDYRVLGTDLSRRVLQHAEAAEYREAQVQPIPLPLRRKYLLRSEADPGLVRVVRRLRARVSFRHLNLLDDAYGLGGPVDVVFCRNVFIYFERVTQAAVLERFARALAPGGFLFLGHSESATALPGAFESVAPTVYRRRGRA